MGGLLPSLQPLQTLPVVHPEGIQDGKEHDTDPWTVKVHILGTIQTQRAGSSTCLDHSGRGWLGLDTRQLRTTGTSAPCAEIIKGFQKRGVSPVPSAARDSPASMDSHIPLAPYIPCTLKGVWMKKGKNKAL